MFDQPSFLMDIGMLVTPPSHLMTCCTVSMYANARGSCTSPRLKFCASLCVLYLTCIPNGIVPQLRFCTSPRLKFCTSPRLKCCASPGVLPQVLYLICIPHGIVPQLKFCASPRVFSETGQGGEGDRCFFLCQIHLYLP